MFSKTICVCIIPVCMLFAKKKMMEETNNNNNKNVLITGFGPFGDHQINASWEAVSLLPDRIGELNIIKKQIPVAYNYIENKIPLLWQKYNPQLVIHVGVSGHSTEIQIETCANRIGYGKLDIENNCPANGQVCCNRTSMEIIPDCIKTELCTKTLCEKLNEHPDLKASISNDPGRYLCEFIYYVSLSQDNKKTLFIHVPPLEKPFSKTQLAEALELIIKYAFEMVNQKRTNSGHLTLSLTPTKIYENGRVASF